MNTTPQTEAPTYLPPEITLLECRVEGGFGLTTQEGIEGPARPLTSYGWTSDDEY